MEKRVVFQNRLLPYLLVLPQLVITVVFFLWPASQAIYQSFLVADPFGLGSQFVWFENFSYVLGDRYYLEALWVTAVFSFAVTALSMSVALLLAVFADRVIKGATGYRTLIIWPYAVAPAIAGVMWLFLFNPSIGLIAYALKSIGYRWNHVLNGGEAMLLVVIAASWKQISYNFLFFLAGLQAIPKGVIEAAALDGAGPWQRFWMVVFPLLSPTTFFLLVVNLVYAFFETFGIIHTVTSGGPGRSTTILVYKVYADGFVGQDLGASAAQSVI
ncbi:MAG: sn-glycerol-3-phosphate ABC transporter permease UgpA, partial [Geminicoccaceae bacterium]